MNRHSAARRVLKSIAVGPKKINLPFTAPDGSKPIVVATPAEYLSDVIARVEAAGGSANVVLAEAKSFVVFTLMGSESDTVDDAVESVNTDMSMGMLWLKYNAQRKKSGSKVRYTMNSHQAVMPVSSEHFEYSS